MRAPRLKASQRHGGTISDLEKMVMEAATGHPLRAAAGIATGGMGASAPISLLIRIFFMGNPFFQDKATPYASPALNHFVPMRPPITTNYHGPLFIRHKNPEFSRQTWQGIRGVAWVHSEF